MKYKTAAILAWRLFFALGAWAQSSGDSAPAIAASPAELTMQKFSILTRPTSQ